MLEDPMFAVVFILEYVIGEPVSDEDRKVGIICISYYPLKHQSPLQQTTNFVTSFPIFDKNEV